VTPIARLTDHVLIALCVAIGAFWAVQHLRPRRATP
jgi:hypothetical protein